MTWPTYRAWKASVAYLDGSDIKSNVAGGPDQKENEADFRLDYVVQAGPLKGSVLPRTGTYHGKNTGTADQDQTRLIFNYTYAIFNWAAPHCVGTRR